ncbi:aromatic ring-hydroxylating dioxygenase subunit alpha [Roseovarius sp. EL26]|uniref:aromatic ring-hydroxylating oxygenase subunit alpha n=1 Tax=Roseovarius sp. EL26 TaxID=2126672 RepID=UPI000EA18F5A|nr:aromatic ring-hydroxylating dioxygenase subunit alpha [Roseovarius sp. EL26]
MPEIAELRSTLQDLAALPKDGPRGLPGVFYTSQAYFDWECEHVLKDGWHCLGRVDEVPEPGDFFTIQVLKEPLIVVRGDDDEIRVLANVCRHRGMPLAEGQGNVKRFICSYHAWAYGRDGDLLRAPRMENSSFDSKSCKLHGYAVTIWRGFIYCNLNPVARPMSEAEALDTLVAPYESEKFRLVHSAQETWKTNWKCLVENFMEGYHLSVVHPQTLHGYTPTGMAKKAASGPGFTSYNANYPEATETRGHGAPDLSEAERRRSSLFARFPNQVASQAATLLVSLMIFPRGPEEIEVKWTMSTYGDELDDATIAQRISLWEDVNREDREKLERMQVSLNSAHAESGPLAGDDYEGTVHDFLLWLAEEDRQYEQSLVAAE